MVVCTDGIALNAQRVCRIQDGTGAIRASMRRNPGLMAVPTASIMSYGRLKMIRINDDWIIDVDEYNYILKRDMHRRTSRKKKDGSVVEEDVYVNKGYFSNMEKALERVREEMVREGLKDASHTLETAVHAIREVTEEWRRITANIMEESA